MTTPLGAVGDLLIGPRVDSMLRRARAQAPDRIALRLGDTQSSYAELDDRVTGFAAALRRIVGSGAVIGLVGALDPAFAVGYYGISRSGNTSTLINPFLREDGLAHLLGTSGAVAAIVTPEVERRLPRERLPLLRHVIPLHDLPFDNTELTDESADIACVLFTSGTTGAPKAIPLTHRNLCVNAAQTAHAQDIGPESVLLNGLPTFHLMHLNAAVCAAATQVLWTGDDITAAIPLANDSGVTHFYTLPMRLARLAADPRLPELALPNVRALLSGGSALPAATAELLAAHFHLPVVQGYGLAEASPLTHFNTIDRPRPGTCGRPIAGTECRVVDLDSREPLPDGARGEIQVRGPQVMIDGWLDTGDVGLIDADGDLVIVDRLKDVFKCDNYLVAPTEIEAVLRQHRAVRECAVVDRPDRFSGAVAVGFAVVREPVDAAELIAFVNERVPHYQQLHQLNFIDAIPRSPIGKVARRELRDRVLSGAQQEGRSAVVTFVNRFTVTGDEDEFKRLLSEVTGYMKRQPGFLSYQLYRSMQDPKVYVETGEWQDSAAHQNALRGNEFQQIVQQLVQHASARIDICEPVA